MQDIPRNELLYKLATGWKVRRKSWSAGDLFGGTNICRSISAKQLLADDWEGEPPEPRRMYEGCAITFAFEKLRNGAAFIRRSSWPEGRRTYLMADRFEIHIEELLATDWEVWS